VEFDNRVVEVKKQLLSVVNNSQLPYSVLVMIIGELLSATNQKLVESLNEKEEVVEQCQ
jgi:hypothetical protein